MNTKTYEWTQEERTLEADALANEAGAQAEEKQMDFSIQAILPDYGSYQADVEENTGHSITTDEMFDVLMDFGKWPVDCDPVVVSTEALRLALKMV